MSVCIGGASRGAGREVDRVEVVLPTGEVLRQVVVAVDERRLAEDALDAVRLRDGGAGPQARPARR